MIRLDQALVERGLCDSRERAKRAILAGQVRVNGQPASPDPPRWLQGAICRPGSNFICVCIFSGFGQSSFHE